MSESKPTVHPDGQLIACIGEGDLSALGALYDRYRLQVFHTALAITRDRQVAEDILQEVFLKVHAYASRIDLSVSLAPWLYRVAVNLSYTWATRQSRWQHSLDALIDKLVAPQKSVPDHQYDVHYLRESIVAALEALPFHHRAVMILYYLSGLSLKEIAYILDCPVGTAKSRLHYGRDMLRRQLAGRIEQPVPAREVAYEFT